MCCLPFLWRCGPEVDVLLIISRASTLSERSVNRFCDVDCLFNVRTFLLMISQHKVGSGSYHRVIKQAYMGLSTVQWSQLHGKYPPCNDDESNAEQCNRRFVSGSAVYIQGFLAVFYKLGLRLFFTMGFSFHFFLNFFSDLVPNGAQFTRQKTMFTECKSSLVYPSMFFPSL